MFLCVYLYDKPLFLFEGPPPPEQWERTPLVSAYSGPYDWTGIIYMLKHNLTSSACLWFPSGEMKSAINEFFQPMDAAGGLTKNHHGEFLCIKRLGRWDLPKGKIEPGEDIAACAVREVEEECGLSNPRIVRELGTTYHAYEHHHTYVLKTTHWFEMMCEDEKSPVPQESEQISEAVWVKKNQLPEVLESTYPSIREVFSRHSS